MKKTKKKNKNELVGKKKQHIKKRKRLEGVVVSNKMQKTVVVKVTTKKSHPLYQKVLKRSKRYKAHSHRELSVGDKVRIEQCKPISKEKKWRVIESALSRDKKI